MAKNHETVRLSRSVAIGLLGASFAILGVLVPARTCYAIDCNSNGVEDTIDIAGGTSADCNSNSIPDECEIASGTSIDCDGNGVPDNCEIAAGTAVDANTNGVIDACEVIFVDADQALPFGQQDGTSWATAYRHLQDGLDRAEALQATGLGAPTQVWVADGTYYPDRSGADEDGSCTPGPCNRTATFQLLNNVEIYGGFTGGEIDILQRVVDMNSNGQMLNTTTLSGDLAGNDLPGFDSNGENSFHVVTANGTNSAALLDGFTITAGHADGSLPGGGILNNSGSPRIAHCRIKENRAFHGGGMYNNGSDPSVSYCIFRHNRDLGPEPEGVGAGVVNTAISCPTFADCIFRANIAEGSSGGGMYNDGGSCPQLIRCEFFGNSGRTGGAIYSSDATLMLQDTLIWFNPSTVNGGGLLNFNSDVTITGCTFIQNTSDAGSGGAVAQGAGTLMVSDTSFTDNRVGIVAGTGRGGAVDLSSVTARFERCMFTSNGAALGSGGAICSDASSMAVEDCSYTSNESQNGGGGALLLVNGGIHLISRSQFLGNSSAMEGGAAHLQDSNAAFDRCTFLGNLAGTFGGGVYNNNSPTHMTNCLLSGNTAVSSVGGAIYNTNASPQLVNCTVSRNHAAGGAGGIHYASGSFGTISSSIVWGNSTPGGVLPAVQIQADFMGQGPTVSYSNVFGGYAGVGNIVGGADPRFLNDLGTDGLAGTEDDDLRLGELSPCIDAGTNGEINEWLSDNGGNGHAYELILYPNAIWANARAIAEVLGGERESYLATVTTPEENAFVLDVINVPGVSAVLIGGIQPDDGQPEVTPADFASGWEWITGEPWVWTNWSQFPSPEGQPNQSGCEEDFLLMWGPALTSNPDIDLGEWVDHCDMYLDPDSTSFLVEFPEGAVDLAGNDRLVDVPWMPLPGDTTVRVDMGAYEHQPDCDSNGIRDDGDLAAGSALDCNTNSVIDSCDIQFAFSTDIDSDGVPDDCDDPQFFCNWTGAGGSTSWDTPANWLPTRRPNNLPGNNPPELYHATIGPAAAFTVAGPAPSATIETFAIGANAGISGLNLATTLTVNEQADINAGGRISLTANNATLDGGEAVIAPGGQLRTNGAGGDVMRVLADVENSGEIRIGLAQTLNALGSAFSNGPDGTINVLTNADLFVDSPSVSQSGTITASGGAGVLFNSTQLINSNGAVIDLVGATLACPEGILNRAGGLISGVGGQIDAEIENEGVIEFEGTLTINGDLTALPGGVVTASGSFNITGTIHDFTAAGGTIMLSAGGGSGQLSGRSLIISDFGLVTVEGASDITLTADIAVSAMGQFAPSGPTDAMVSAINVIVGSPTGAGGSLVLDHDISLAAISISVAQFGCSCCGLRGCVEPRIQAAGNASISAQDLTLSNHGTVDLEGASSTGLSGIVSVDSDAVLSILDAADLAVQGDLSIGSNGSLVLASSQPAVLGGDFVNQSTDPSLFNALNGRLLLDGSIQQNYEVAGTDLGPLPAGLNLNFAIGELEVAADSDVRFVDAFDNNASGQAPCTEALYVSTLILGDGSSIELDNVRLYYGTLIYEGGSVSTNGCGELVAIVTGDIDNNGIVNGDDYAAHAECLGGPNIAPNPNMPLTTEECLDTFDFDRDGDVDLADSVTLMIMFELSP